MAESECKPSDTAGIDSDDEYLDAQQTNDETGRSKKSIILEKIPLIVVAIDFGTTYSGWAFSARSDYCSNPDKIHTRIWYNGENTMLKTNTCILFDEEGYRNGQSYAFGYDALEKYMEICNENTQDSYYFFREYKMFLYENMDISSKSTLTADNGKKMNALTVFSESIRFLVGNFNNRLDTIYNEVNSNEIRWVLTVPAIWNEKAKSFMREAAIKAGIESNQLLIALEPEAAALYCKNLPTLNNEGFFSIFELNSKYMVVDIGGGTFDITVNTVARNGIEELKRANGGSCGGASVNKEFWDLLMEVYGKNIITKFKTDHPDDYLVLEQSFEVKKKNIAFNDKRSDINMVIPSSLHNVFMEGALRGEIDEEWVPQKFDGRIKVMFRRGIIKINRKIIENLFQKSSFEIFRTISDMLTDPKLHDLHAILLLGGFSDSPLLYEKLKAHIGMENQEILVLRPPEAVGAVLKGAVQFGHEPDIFRKRICRYTYGIQTNMPYDENEDHESRLIADEDGVKYCRYRFSKHATCGDAYQTGAFNKGVVYVPFRGDQKFIKFPVYVSNEQDPRYTSFNCDYIGSLSIDLSNLPKEDEQVVVSIKFGETELATVKAIEIKTGKEVHAELSFI